MLRLDPAHPPVWSTPTRLQLGAEAVAVLDDPQPWEQRLLRDLQHGFPESALGAVAAQYDVGEAQARTLVRRLEAALVPPAPVRQTVRLQVAESVESTDAAAIADALAAHGLLDSAPGAESPATPVPVVLLAHHVVDPRHAAALLHDDIPHLPIVLAGSRAVVGPFVRPGLTACLACVEARRAETDPSWPAIAAQLLGRSGPPVGRAFASEVGLAAGRLLSAPERVRPVAHSLSLSTGSLRRVWRAHRPHADCRCRSLEGIERPVARLDPDRETTTGTGFSRRA
jgi:bacteriocin biosynthesis cyclodehydratase domain-containing protein